MGKSKEIAAAGELIPENITKEINDLHYSIKGHMQRTIEEALQLGELLTAVKERLPHGQFIPWIETNCEFSRMTATRYMKVFRKGQEMKCNTVLHLSGMYRLLSAPKTDEEDERDVQLEEINEDEEKKELIGAVEKLEEIVSRLEKEARNKEKKLLELQKELSDTEDITKSDPEIIKTMNKILELDPNADWESDLEETAELDRLLKNARRFFREDVLRLELFHLKEVSKKTLRMGVVDLITAMSSWIQRMMNLYQIDQGEVTDEMD